MEPEVDGYGNLIDPSAAVTAPVRRGRQPKPAVDALEHNLEPSDLTLMHESQSRDWKTNRATEDEREAIVRVGEQLEHLGSTAREIAKSFGISTLTYSNWKKAPGKAPASTGRPGGPRARGRRAASRAAAKVATARSRYIAEIDLAPVVAENREVVIELLTIGKPQAIKNAIRSLIEED